MDATTPPEFDFALSFAGEDRNYVTDLAERLKRSEFRVFLDSDYLAETWGEDLTEFFDRIYRKSSRFVIMFISRHYADKMWPRYERRSALARALHERAAYVLPIRLDDTEIEGLRPTIGFIDARRVGLEGIVSAAVQKANGRSAAPVGDFRAPRDEAEAQQLLAATPVGWEYMYYSGRLWAEMNAADSAYRDWLLGHRITGDVAVPDDEALDELSDQVGNLIHLVDRLNALMLPANQAQAFGEPGEPGDPEMIRRLAVLMNNTYVDAIDWSLKMRGAVVSDEYRGLRDIGSRYADGLINNYREFVYSFMSQCDGLQEMLRANVSGQPLRLESTLLIDIPEDVLSDFANEIERLRSTR